MDDLRGEQADLEQAIGDTEIAITAQRMLLDRMTRAGEGAYRETQQLRTLRARLDFYHLRRRMLIGARAVREAQARLEGGVRTSTSPEPTRR